MLFKHGLIRIKKIKYVKHSCFVFLTDARKLLSWQCLLLDNISATKNISTCDEKQ